jgi:hypothetical protein
VRSVAERDIRGVATTAESDGSATSQAELLSFLIDDLEIAFDTNRPIVEDSYLGCCHEILREIGKYLKAHAQGTFTRYWRWRWNTRKAAACRLPWLVARDGVIDFGGPGQNSAVQIVDLAETGLAQEVHRLCGALSASAVRDDFAR